jgi:hydrogenase nickel incorporation protein HypA/HybF
MCRTHLLSRDQLIRKSAHSFRSGFPNSLGGIRRKKIHEVRLAIGELSHIEHEQLRFCYQSITKETPLEGSTLKIDKTEALVECPYCSYRGRPKYWDHILAGAPVVTFQCPASGKTVEETQGKECENKSIRFSPNEPILTDEPARS